ncbi:tetratricopeptide repeat protein [Bdellovibrio sp. SKB1291214]|uniref:tetratricopeptide repeat protein n=1 Tax=Bdellovibrio sp. SKB1291214 TaxID=1732569 RepID=UPI00223F48F2|nr:tetratricopeptide repeat protein [Bdellovibrio sp. SKB1291214]UYL09160.1 tetratricopeptide repeat protein [Bdellovibrio sp. SKB1291214]
MKLLATLATISLFMTGCLQTRNDVRDNEQRQVYQQQVSTMQRQTADAGNRFSDLEEQMRAMNGRVDVVENRLENNNLDKQLKAAQQQNEALNKKVDLLQEGFTNLEKQVYALNAQVNALNANRQAAEAEAKAAAERAAAEKAVEKSKKNQYEVGQEYFNKKEWKQAILSYQKYRDESPKGSHFADATYKIGVSFQELGMKEESKTFFDEVLSKFPKSDEARRAKIRLKGLK